MAKDLDLRGDHSNPADWLANLLAQDVQYLILDVASDDVLLQQVRRESRWRIDFDDGESAICIRDLAETMPRRGEC